MSICLFVSCRYFRGDNCNNTLSIIGTYENIYDNEAKNLLIIKYDGSFKQKFTKEGITKTNVGSWTFFNESCSIILTNLTLMHKLGIYEKELFSENGKYRLNKIVFVEDLPKEFDYYRIK